MCVCGVCVCVRARVRENGGENFAPECHVLTVFRFLRNSYKIHKNSTRLSCILKFTVTVPIRILLECVPVLFLLLNRLTFPRKFNDYA